MIVSEGMLEKDKLPTNIACNCGVSPSKALHHNGNHTSAFREGAMALLS
jgi:hypothetical protein